jgi:ABC-type taurine transport system ATPase subunit
VIDSDVWPDEVEVLAQDQAGQRHRLARAKHGDVANMDDPVEGLLSFPVECYGQGETHEISQRAQTDPAALLEYLDRFVDVAVYAARESEIRELLLKSQTEIEGALQKVELIPAYERNLKYTRSQIAAVEKENAKEIIVLQRKIEIERQAQRSILQHLQSLLGSAKRDDLRAGLMGIRTSAIADSLVAGMNEFAAIQAQVTAFEQTLDVLEANLKQSTEALAKTVRDQLAAWKVKEYAIQSQIDEKKTALEAAGVRVDMAFIQKLAADEARLQRDVANLTEWKPHLARLRKDRKSLLAERWSIREKIGQRRNAFGRGATDALRVTLLDLNVSLKFDLNAYSPEANQIIVDALGWKTVQVPRAEGLTQILTIPKLLEAIGSKSIAAIAAVTGADGSKLFSKQEATRILDRLSEASVRFRLERCEVVDRPRLSVTKLVTDETGQTHARTREFRQLSLGQQQSVLLALMLSADAHMPLLIDQPEDNLDGEFIYRSIVPVLRWAKERRQVIVVTHNANIAVLGDAEQIVVLRATNENAVIVARGSIDDAEIREEACAILEGSREAFKRRARVYGPVA